MGADLACWMFGADEEVSTWSKSDPGNVDLLKTMPLPDSAANAGTPMPENIADHEGEQIIHKFDRFEKAKRPGIMTGSEELGSEKKSITRFLKASSHFLLERDRCAPCCPCWDGSNPKARARHAKGLYWGAHR